MSVDKLQDRIRKLKSPLAVDLFAKQEHIPPQFFSGEMTFLQAYQEYCGELLEQLDGTVAAVRLDYGMLSLYGSDGITVLTELSVQAHKLGYYVLLQIGEPLSRQNAEFAAEMLFDAKQPVYFDGLIMAAYIGSDAIVPFFEQMKGSDKDLFVVARTSNRSAAEMQDLLTGSRLAYMAKADIVNRYVDPLIGRCGYARVALMAAAASADCLRGLRGKYKNIFLLLDGCDYPNANAKNCSAAFDKFGHGAVACAGLSVLAAWKDELENPSDYIGAAQKAAERHKRNLIRYVTIL